MIVQMIIRPGPYALSISLGGSRSYVFDGKGRLVYAHLDDTALRRGLGNQLVGKRGGCGAGEVLPVGRELEPAEKAVFFANLHEELWAGRALVASGQVSVEGGSRSRASALDWLDRALSWDYAALEADAAEFRRIYPHSVSSLPPDRWLSIFLQLTEGCTQNRCAICPQRDRPFRVKDLSEFQAHAEEVSRFLGADRLRRGVFLGDANALTLTLPRLREYLSIAGIVFPKALTGPGSGFSSFLDLFTEANKAKAHWVELATLGLRRVYIGIETGNRELLSLLGRPVGPMEVLEGVMALRAAGIAVGVIVTAGVGGQRYHASHTQGTAALIRCLDLGERDTLYISEFVVQPRSRSEQEAAELGIHPASPAQIAEQVRVFCRSTQVPGRPGPRVAAYPISEYPY